MGQEAFLRGRLIRLLVGVFACAGFLAGAAPPLQPRHERPDPGLAQPVRERGRDPWVFRCIFEDRTRMVVLALGDGLWVAFNPATCAIQKVWRGDMDFRGKVWDFSQDNCAAKGTVLADASPPLLSLPGDSLPSDWDATSVAPASTPGGSLAMTTDGATLTSPAIDTLGIQRLFVAFDEASRAGPVLVEVSRDDGATWDAQFFRSATHVTSDTVWQWNFKELAVRAPRMRIRFVQEKGAYAKRLRNVRIFGDRAAWSARGAQGAIKVEPVWRGYEIDGRVQGVTLMYDLRLTSKGPEEAEAFGVVHIRHGIDLAAPPDNAWTETYELVGIPAGTSVALNLPDCAPGPFWTNGPGRLTMADGRFGLEFSSDGSTCLTKSVERDP